MTAKSSQKNWKNGIQAYEITIHHIKEMQINIL